MTREKGYIQSIGRATFMEGHRMQPEIAVGTRERVVDLLDRLSEGDLRLVEDLVERLSVHPFAARWDALPADDEPLTEEDRRALAHGMQEYLQGKCSQSVTTVSSSPSTVRT